MVETITPAVHGGRRAGHWVSAAAHVLGAALAAATVGVALGALGGVLGAPWGWPGGALLAVTAGLYTLGEAGAVRLPTFAAGRQVPEWWRRFYAPQTSALLYGVSLGFGFATTLSHGTLVVVCAAALLSGEPQQGLLFAAPFGIARGASAVVGGRWATRTIDRLDELAATPLARTANGTVLVAVAAAALVP
jgi:hypothetical protein